MAGFARTGDCIKSPLLLAARYVIGGEKPPSAELACGDPDHDGMIDDERGAVNRVTIGGTSDQRLPDNLSIVRVNRNQIAVQTAEKERAAGDREAPIHSELYRQAGRNSSFVFPNRGPGLRIQRDDMPGI